MKVSLVFRSCIAATSRTEPRTTHLETVSFIVWGHWIILRGISHQTQTSRRRSGDSILQCSIFGTNDGGQLPIFISTYSEIWEKVGEIYCCCIEQNYWEPLHRCVFSVTIHSITFKRNFSLCTNKETRNTFLSGFHLNMCTVNRAPVKLVFQIKSFMLHLR